MMALLCAAAGGMLAVGLLVVIVREPFLGFKQRGPEPWTSVGWRAAPFRHIPLVW
eukprot:UN3043